MSKSKSYRGRFAPSPTGPLHFGSLVAAMGSYLQAKYHNGEWLLRIDDIDPPREQKGAKNNILTTLEDFGFEWDSDVLYQNSKLNRYQEAVNDLLKQQRAYPCSCSKKSLIKQTGQTEGEIVYPGFCRNKKLEESPQHSIRLRCDNELIYFDDAIQGKQAINLENIKGDFVIQRRDRHFSYQLASGIDDAEQGITEVVRGADLLNCTPCQLHVQRMLNLPSPQYCHLPIALNEAGQKLSKQSHAKPITSKNSVLLLYEALKFLGQKPPIDIMKGSQQELWLWAKAHWQLNSISK
jgi:glutamyl-Q tRNA(Asp) synthetase